MSDCDAVLLDMNGTFMFGGDRFDDRQDYVATYKEIGGHRLSDDLVLTRIAAVQAKMAALYSDPECLECFPTVYETLGDLSDLTAIDCRQLAEVIARHEIGHVSTEYASTLRWLADRFVIGLVTNLWSEKTLWLRELERAGVASLFQTMVFSSDHSSIKPSSKLFEMALADLRCDASNVLFIGDDLHRDMEGAQALGFRTLWIGKGDPRPSITDGIVPDLLDLPGWLQR
ncbi:MAG: HAD family hydrolase [Pseudomonadota bacterium]